MNSKIGIDVGGTFTDFLLMEESGDSEIYKTLTTFPDPSVGVFNGLNEMAEKRGCNVRDFLQEVEIIVHGTTVTTNAILTNSGVKTGLLTTKGFRDALQMRRGMREELYNNRYEAPKPLVRRSLRWPVEERVTHTGDMTKPLQEQDVKTGVEHFKKNGVKAIAICFLHSYANPDNERKALEIVAEQVPEAYVTLSSKLLPQVRFYNRISTTVLNSYVGPILRDYLLSLIKKLDAANFKGVLLIMQSNGGVTSPQVAMEMAASTLLSGPAAGPIAGIAYTSIQGYEDCITVDMGGTSFDAALVKEREPLLITDGNINRHLIAMPILGIHTIGAGGGSIGWIDDGGLLHVGPQSAGANPGPVCYSVGGTEPTCTDADLVLGYLNPDFFLGGKIKLDVNAAEHAIKEHIAKPLGLSLTEAAAGMYHLINVSMASGIKEVSIQRGFDPRDFPLVVAGGAGPIHAGLIALELEIGLIIIPKESSIFCAAGMLLSDLKHDFVRTYHGIWHSLSHQKFKALFKEMEDDGYSVLRKENINEERIKFIYSCDLRYAGQYHEVTVEVKKEEILDWDIPGILERFHKAHDRLYGYRLDDTPVASVNLRISAIGVTDKPKFNEEEYAGEDPGSTLKGVRPVYLPNEKAFASVNVYDGHNLKYGNRILGPAIIEQIQTTIFVPPEYHVALDKYGSYTMTLSKTKSA